MSYMKEGLLSKVKSLISIIYGVFLWLTRLSSHDHFQLGLDALIFSTARKLNRVTYIIHFFTVAPPPSSPSSLPLPSSSFSSSSSSWLSVTGDLIGTESGVYMSSNEETLPGVIVKTAKSSTSFPRKLNPRIENRSREYPPPMPSLARTTNLTSRTPWVLTRHYVNGRLILREERVKNYEYFEAERDNGRFILNLIPLDDTRKCAHMDDDLEQAKLQFVQEEEEDDEDSDDRDDDIY